MTDIHKIIYLSGLFLLALLSQSCGGGTDCVDEADYVTQFNDQITVVNSAITTFTNGSQTDADCNTFANALNDGISALEDLQGCADEFGRSDEVRNNVTSLQNTLSGLPCS